jgi:hypothetical protein
MAETEVPLKELKGDVIGRLLVEKQILLACLDQLQHGHSIDGANRADDSLGKLADKAGPTPLGKALHAHALMVSRALAAVAPAVVASPDFYRLIADEEERHV